MAPEDDAHNVHPALGIGDKAGPPGIARGKMPFVSTRIETMKQQWATVPGKAEEKQQFRGQLLVKAVAPQSEHSRWLEISLQAVSTMPISSEVNQQVV